MTDDTIFSIGILMLQDIACCIDILWLYIIDVITTEEHIIYGIIYMLLPIEFIVAAEINIWNATDIYIIVSMITLFCFVVYCNILEQIIKNTDVKMHCVYCSILIS